MSSKPKPAPRKTAKLADGDRPVRITVDLPRSIHYRLKLAALQNRRPASELARPVLDAHLPVGFTVIR